MKHPQVQQWALQPSASRTDLLLACQRPFGPDLEIEPEEPHEPSRYGSAFHRILASLLRAKREPVGDFYANTVDRAAEEYDVRAAREELAGHAKSSLKVLKNWLQREELEVVEVEQAYAVDPHASSIVGRKIPPHDEDHRYDCDPYELPGTVDLVARGRKRTVVLDHKTGMDKGFAKPASIAQMKTLGLIDPDAELAIFHADRRGLPIVYAEEYERADRKEHAKAVATALGRIGDGYLHPGPLCKDCPAYVGCPAHSADLLAESTAQLVAAANVFADEPVDPKKMLVSPANGSTLETRASALYDLLKRFRALNEAGMEEIKRLVREGRVIETRGGPLVLQKQTFETLSKKSVVEALGKVAGERELKRLRGKGAIRESTREMLTVDKKG